MPTHYRPAPVKGFNAIRGGLSKLGLKPKAFDANVIFDKALKSSGVLAQGDYSHLKERLELICNDLNAKSSLHPTGHLITQMSLQNSIQNRLQIDAHIAANSEILERKVEKPVFILGLPRTGTTALFNILGSVEGIRAPLGWEVNKPVPPVEFASRDSDPRIKKTHQEFEAFFYLTPTLRVIHDFGALLPQECIAITQYDLYTGQFWFCYDIPSYFDWYKKQDPTDTFRFHKIFAQLLQSDFPNQQYLFKTPFHLPVIEQLLDVYPDARIIQTHRDPMEVMGSVCSFAWHLRSTFSDEIDCQQIGKDQLDFWSECLSQSVTTRDKLADKADQFFDVDYRTFVDRPIDTVSSILEFLGEDGDEETTQRLIQYADTNKKDKHGKHVYSLNDYGLDAVRDKSVFENYCKRFNL